LEINQMNMPREQFIQMLDICGADFRRWPAALRSQAQQCVQHDPELQALWQQASALDSALDCFAVPAFHGLEQRLLQMQLPARPAGSLERIVEWLVPEGSALRYAWWRPAALACVPLLFGVVIGLQSDMYADYSVVLSVEEELYFISLSDYAEVL